MPKILHLILHSGIPGNPKLTANKEPPIKPTKCTLLQAKRRATTGYISQHKGKSKENQNVDKLSYSS